MMIFLSTKGTADAKGGLKGPASRPVLTGVWGRKPPTSERRVYTGALLATMVKSPTEVKISPLYGGSYLSYNERESVRRCIA